MNLLAKHYNIYMNRCRSGATVVLRTPTALEPHTRLQSAYNMYLWYSVYKTTKLTCALSIETVARKRGF